MRAHPEFRIRLLRLVGEAKKLRQVFITSPIVMLYLSFQKEYLLPIHKEGFEPAEISGFLYRIQNLIFWLSPARGYLIKNTNICDIQNFTYLLYIYHLRLLNYMIINIL